jgi:hypothetical protein
MEPNEKPTPKLGPDVTRLFDKVKNDWMEGVFYVLVLVAAINAGNILWDLFTMMPWFPRLMGTMQPNSIFNSKLMVDAFLTLLSFYGGGREVVRWGTSIRQQVTVEMLQEIEQQARWYARSGAIVLFWLLLLVVSGELEILHHIPRLPYELSRLALDSFMIWTGVRASRQIHKVVTKRKAADAGIALPKKETRPEPPAAPLAVITADPDEEDEDEGAEEEGNVRIGPEHRTQVIEYLKKTRYIQKSECSKLTGLSKPQSRRLLTAMTEDKILVAEGESRGKKYRLADDYEQYI